MYVHYVYAIPMFVCMKNRIINYTLEIKRQLATYINLLISIIQSFQSHNHTILHNIKIFRCKLKSVVLTIYYVLK